VALGLERSDEDADDLPEDVGVPAVTPDDDEDMRDTAELPTREEREELLETASEESTALVDAPGRFLLPMLGTLGKGLAVALDALESFDAMDAWLNTELLLDTLSVRASMLRCAARHASESRFVKLPSSSSLLRGEDGTGARDVPLELGGVSWKRCAEGVWKPSVGFGGLRGVCGVKGRSRSRGVSEPERLGARL
jgi:hypothetical protein